MEESSRKATPLSGFTDTLGPQIALTALRALGWSFRLRPALRPFLRVGHPRASNHPTSLTINFTTTDGHSQVWVCIDSDRVRSGPGRLPTADASVFFRSEPLLRHFLVQSTDADLLTLCLEEKAFVRGSLACVAKFAHIAAAARHAGIARPRSRPPPQPDDDAFPDIVMRRGDPRPFGAATGAVNLRDPAFPGLTLASLPSLRRCLEAYLRARPRVSIERARLFAEAITDGTVQPSPCLRRANALSLVLSRRRPTVHEGLLVLGTTTEHRIGAPVYPELDGALLWPELAMPDHRPPNLPAISRDEADALANHLLPPLMFDSFRHLWKAEPHGDLCGGRFVVGEPEGLSSSIPDFETILTHGLHALARESRDMMSAAATQNQRDHHEAAALCLEAACDHAQRVADKAELVARSLDDHPWRAPLLAAALSARRSPAAPAETLLDALNAIRICIACLHQESFDGASGLGRLDLLLQPFFLRDLQRAPTQEARESAAVDAVELVASFFLSLADHVPLRPRALAGMHPAGPTLSVTIGGSLANGASATCDMTYVILKASELIALPVPHIHARFAPAVNPDYYLRRVCEVGVLTGATPSIHFDPAYVSVLEALQVPKPRANDWAIAHAGTPTLAGEHAAHPCSVILDLNAALAAARDSLPPSNGDGDTSVLLDAFRDQVSKLAREATTAARNAAATLAESFPVPLLSALVQGTSESGLDVSAGGARYNTACVLIRGLADVVVALSALSTSPPRHDLETLDQQRIADLVIEIVDGALHSQEPVRGGPFVPSYCSQGVLLPSHLAARLPPSRMAGGTATVVHLAAGHWDHADHVDHLVALAQTFFDAGGMQLQVSTADPAVLREADMDPARYRDVIVPIPGADARYVDLSEDTRAAFLRHAEDALALQAPASRPPRSQRPP